MNEDQKEIERLQGEFAALQNVFVGIIRDTIIARPEVKTNMIRDLRREIARLEAIPGMSFAKEGAQRFYKTFISLIDASIHYNPPEE